MTSQISSSNQLALSEHIFISCTPRIEVGMWNFSTNSLHRCMPGTSEPISRHFTKMTNRL